MSNIEFTLQILRTVVTIITVLCYTVSICFVIARSESRLACLLPLPLLGVLYHTVDGGERGLAAESFTRGQSQHVPRTGDIDKGKTGEVQGCEGG